jgi:hypothetical protein
VPLGPSEFNHWFRDSEALPATSSTGATNVCRTTYIPTCLFAGTPWEQSVILLLEIIFLLEKKNNPPPWKGKKENGDAQVLHQFSERQ